MFVWPFLFCFVLIFEFWFSRYFSLFWKMDFVSFLFRFCFFLFGFYWKWKWEFMNSRKSAVGIFQTGRLIASAICFVNFYLMGMFLILFPFEFFIGLLLLCIYIFFFESLLNEELLDVWRRVLTAMHISAVPHKPEVAAEMVYIRS